MSTNRLRLIITSGDTDGIGLEVTAKALQKIGPLAGVQFYFYRGKSAPKKYLDWIDKSFTRISCESLSGALKLAPLKPKSVIEIISDQSPAKWVHEAALFAEQKKIDGIITAPLSKTEIANAGFKEVGHTEIFRSVCKTEDLFMGFIGEKFAVVLTTGHIPLAKVPHVLNLNVLKKSMIAAVELRKILEKSRNARPIALVGLNPHAGEDGLIGTEEKDLFSLAIKSHGISGLRVEGPLVPDAAFLPMNWPKYSVFLCPYHDQGLIPFKMVHGKDHGVHITLGLPFVRTSVDHGTAKGIFGLDKANATSMLRAIKLAVLLSKAKKKRFKK